MQTGSCPDTHGGREERGQGCPRTRGAAPDEPVRPSQSFQNARELVLSKDTGHSDLLTQNIPERMSFCVFKQSTSGSGPEASDGVKDTSLLPAEHRTSQGPESLGQAPAGASLSRPSPPRAGGAEAEQGGARMGRLRDRPPGSSLSPPGRPPHPRVILATPGSPVADPPRPCRGVRGAPVTEAVTSPFIHMLDQIWEMRLIACCCVCFNYCRVFYALDTT